MPNLADLPCLIRRAGRPLRSDTRRRTNAALNGRSGSGPGFGVMPDSGRRRSANHSAPWAAAFRRISAALPADAHARNGRLAAPDQPHGATAPLGYLPLNQRCLEGRIGSQPAAVLQRPGMTAAPKLRNTVCLTAPDRACAHSGVSPPAAGSVSAVLARSERPPADRHRSPGFPASRPPARLVPGTLRFP